MNTNDTTKRDPAAEALQTILETKKGRPATAAERSYCDGIAAGLAAAETVRGHG